MTVEMVVQRFAEGEGMDKDECTSGTIETAECWHGGYDEGSADGSGIVCIMALIGFVCGILGIRVGSWVGGSNA